MFEGEELDMIRIGIVGTDGGTMNGHALHVCNILNSDRYCDVTISGLYGENAEETKSLAELQNVSYIANNPSDLIGKVDAVMIMFRDGNKHLSYAKPFLDAGIPVFVDKPFTCTVADAEELIWNAKQGGSLLCGGSYVKYAPALEELRKKVTVDRDHILSGYLSFPVLLESPYGGIHFYSHHAICELIFVFGPEIKAISSTVTNGKLVVVAQYQDFPVIINYASLHGVFHAGLYFDDKPSIMKDLDEAGCDVYQCDRFLDMVRTGAGDESNELLLSVKLSNAIEQSIQTGKSISISEL